MATAAELLDRPPVGHEGKPAGRVCDLLTIKHRRVQPLPGLGIAGLQIARVKTCAARCQAPPHGRHDTPAQLPELLAQKTLGTVATERQGTHRPGDYGNQDLSEHRPADGYLQAIGAPPEPTPVSAPATAEVLGIPLAVSDYEQVLDWMEAMIAAGRRGYLTAAAVNLVMSAREDPDTRAAVLGATLAVPDGQPLVWALHALGHARATRVYGPDLMARILRAGGTLAARPCTCTEAARPRRSSCWKRVCASASPAS